MTPEEKVAAAKEKKRAYDKARNAAYQKANKEKIRARKAYCNKLHPEKNRERSAAWKRAHPEYATAWSKANTGRRYGLAAGDYAALNESQGGKCVTCLKACSVRKRLSVDHDHTTGRVRGLLCSNCNTSIGLAKDSPDTLRRMADYLEKAS